MDGVPETIHATAIALGQKCALIFGHSGAGKSDLALRCILQPRSNLIEHQAVLVSDDRVALDARSGIVYASPPARIAGLIEVRGVGLYKIPYENNIPVELVVQLVAKEQIERLPDPDQRANVCGVDLPCLHLYPFETSAPLKLLLALSDIDRLTV